MTIVIKGINVNREYMEFNTLGSMFTTQIPLEINFNLEVSGEPSEMETLIRNSQVFSLLEQFERAKYTDAIKGLEKENEKITKHLKEAHDKLEMIRKVFPDAPEYEDW